jgi:predicted dienelactone hydrolase
MLIRATGSARLLKFLIATALISGATAQAVGLQFIEVPADADEPVINGAIWYPCAAPVSQLKIGLTRLEATRDCAVVGSALPFIVLSHGYGGNRTSHHDTAETLANAGFVVAAINHPIDSGPDMSRADTVSMFAERPRDIKRLIDYMLDRWPDRVKLDAGKIGFFGFSRGGYTGLVLIGATPDLHAGLVVIPANAPIYDQISSNTDLPSSFTHDRRIHAAVIADPAFGPMFTRASLRAVTVPVQLWASQRSVEDKGIGVTAEYVEAIRDNLPNKPEFHLVTNAGHYSFLAPCSPELAAKFPQLCEDHPGFDRVAFHQQLNAAVLAFFQKHLMHSESTAIRIAKGQKSVSLEKRAEATYAKYHRQKGSPSLARIRAQISLASGPPPE